MTEISPPPPYPLSLLSSFRIILFFQFPFSSLLRHLFFFHVINFSSSALLSPPRVNLHSILIPGRRVYFLQPPPRTPPPPPLAGARGLNLQRIKHHQHESKARKTGCAREELSALVSLAGPWPRPGTLISFVADLSGTRGRQVHCIVCQLKVELA